MLPPSHPGLQLHDDALEYLYEATVKLERARHRAAAATPPRVRKNVQNASLSTREMCLRKEARVLTTATGGAAISPTIERRGPQLPCSCRVHHAERSILYCSPHVNVARASSCISQARRPPGQDRTRRLPAPPSSVWCRAYAREQRGARAS